MAQLIGELAGFKFYVPTSGGKAGRGRNVTSTIQVRRGNQVVKQIRFTVADPASRKSAIERAKAYAQDNATS